MISKKVCMVGAFAVGKTSLVERFVSSIFKDKYQSTVGVNVRKKVVTVSGVETNMMIWDLAGKDDIDDIETRNLKGAHGFILVIDGLRRPTLRMAADLEARVRADCGPMPFVVVVNKADLAEQWEVQESDLESLRANGWPVMKGSAKTGAGVQEAFEAIAGLMLAQSPPDESAAGSA